MKKRLSFLLAILLVLTMLPLGSIGTFAAGEDPVGASTKIYFSSSSAGWNGFTDITVYFYEKGGSPIYPWGSDNGKMTDDGDGMWSYDLAAKGVTLDPDKAYGCIFTADWDTRTCDLIIGAECLGDIAFCTGNMVEDSLDRNKQNYDVRWALADQTKYNTPKCVTSAANVTGNVYWQDEDAYALMVQFLSSDKVDTALSCTGKTEQQLIDDLANTLGLSENDVADAILASGRSFDWRGSTLPTVEPTTAPSEEWTTYYPEPTTEPVEPTTAPPEEWTTYYPEPTTEPVEPTTAPAEDWTTYIEPTTMPPYYWTDPTGADNSDSIGAGSKIYFDSNSAGWKNFGDIFLYLYDHANGEIIPWGSKKGKMKDEGNGKWSFDLSAKSEYLDALKSSTGCGCIFTADWGMQTCDLIIGEPCIGDTAVCTGNKVENNVDSNKKSDEVKWTNADASKYGVPKCITSIGNVIGEAYWPGETPYSMMVKFLDKDSGKFGIDNALKFNGKDAQTTIDDTAAALGLGKDDVERAIAQAGRADLGWKKDQSVAPEQNSNGGSSSSSDPTVSMPQYEFKKLKDGTYAVKNYTGEAANLAIPDYLRVRLDGTISYGYDTDDYSTGTIGYVDVPVTVIDDWAFCGNKYLKSVVIPDTVKRIGNGAFDNCQRLKKVYFEGSVETIGNGAFTDCKSMTTVTLPNSVTSLGANAFEGCLSLTKVKLSNRLEAIPDNAFYDCRSLVRVTIPDSVQSIGDEAFYHCRSLEEILIPEGVTTLGGNAPEAFGVFEECTSLYKAVLPASLTAIADNTFDGCRALTVYGQRNTSAHEFATENYLRFTPIGGVTADGSFIADVDGDDAITINDATLIQQYLAEYEGDGFTGISGTKALACADVTGNGKVTIRDVTAIQRFLAEYIDAFA